MPAPAIASAPAAAAAPSYAVARGDRDLAEFGGGLVMERATPESFVNPNMILLPGQNRFLASVLQPGKRAVSVKIDEVTSNSGLIKPGNKVDLILFTNLSGKNSLGDLTALTILENLRVIAINRNITGDKAANMLGSDGGFESSGFEKSGTATLEVTPRQAEILAVAQRMGTLILSLRSDFEKDNPAGTASATAKRSGVRAHDVIKGIAREKKEKKKILPAPIQQYYRMQSRKKAISGAGW